jgi:hypothetical protein
LTYPNGSKIYFYTHWGGENLPETVAAALNAGRYRWSDPPYLARIIYDYMIASDAGDITGYGISTEYEDSDYGEDDIFVTLSYGDGGKAGISEANMTFDEFIRAYWPGKENYV